MSAEAAKEGWTARMELDTWLSNYQIDPEALGRNEQVLVVTAFMAYWQ